MLNGVLWKDSKKVHHRFLFTDRESGRTLSDTLEIHTLELGRYDLQEKDLSTASILDCWIYWLLHAHEYELEELLRLFPQEAIRQATRTLTQIAEITEDKAMYDSREKALRDRQWELNASRNEAILLGKTQGRMEALIEGKIEGEIEGEIKMIRTFQEILQIPITTELEFAGKTLDELQNESDRLRELIRNRRLP